MKRILIIPKSLGRTAMFVQWHSHLVLPGIGDAVIVNKKAYSHGKNCSDRAKALTLYSSGFVNCHRWQREGIL